MAILKKMPIKKCDPQGNILNIVHHEVNEENIHEGVLKIFQSKFNFLTNYQHPSYAQFFLHIMLVFC